MGSTCTTIVQFGCYQHRYHRHELNCDKCSSTVRLLSTQTDMNCSNTVWLLLTPLHLRTSLVPRLIWLYAQCMHTCIYTKTLPNAWYMYIRHVEWNLFIMDSLTHVWTSTHIHTHTCTCTRTLYFLHMYNNGHTSMCLAGQLSSWWKQDREGGQRWTGSVSLIHPPRKLTWRALNKDVFTCHS